MPSIGSCAIPSTVFGSGMPAASRIVGPTSMTWVNCERRSPPALIRFGQATTIGLRVPPRWLAICLPHWNGVFTAWAQAAAKCGARVLAAQRVDAAVLLDQLELLVGVEDEAVQERHLVERAGRSSPPCWRRCRPRCRRRACCRGRPSPRPRRAGARRSSRRSPSKPRTPPSAGRRASSARRSASPRREAPRGARSARCPAGTIPSFFCRANVCSRSLSQPWSNLPLYLSAHSFGTWWGAWAAAGRVVHHPRLVRVLRPHRVQPLDRLVGHVVREVVRLAVLALGHAERPVVLGDDRVVLTGRPGQEAPPVVEAPGPSASDRTGRPRPARCRA